MEASKRAIAEFTSKKGHTTDVEEVVRPAITLETIKPSRHEIITEAVDREVHQHHYHTTIQPLSHKEVLPTKHSHNLLAMLKRDLTHKTKDINLKVKDSHAKEMALFKDHSVTLPTTHTRASMPVVVGEHVHHHVHEVVQPVIYKETIVPEVVHTTVPIHEVHHQDAIHHRMSELAMVTLEDFTSRQKATTLTRETYDGAPRPYNTKFNIDPTKFRHKPAPINTVAARNSTSTPPLSPASGASSPSMPGTPKYNNTTEPGFRNSEDSAHEFILPNSPTAKTPPKAHHVPIGETRTPQQIRI